MNTNTTKYKSIMIKTELKDTLDETIIKIGKKMSYSQLFQHLLEHYEKMENNQRI